MFQIFAFWPRVEVWREARRLLVKAAVLSCSSTRVPTFRRNSCCHVQGWNEPMKGSGCWYKMWEKWVVWRRMAVACENAEWDSCGEYGAVGTEMCLLQGGKGSYRPQGWGALFLRYVCNRVPDLTVSRPVTRSPSSWKPEISASSFAHVRKEVFWMLI